MGNGIADCRDRIENISLSEHPIGPFQQQKETD
jgi:hypothetical protein